jgi:hypothetical protein
MFAMPSPTLTDLRTAKAAIHQHYDEAKAAGANAAELRNLELAEHHFRTRINEALLAEARSATPPKGRGK